MNKIYRVLWNEASGTYVAAPENARAGRASGTGAAVQGAVEVAGAVGAKAGQALWALLQPLLVALVSAGLVHAAGPAPDQLPVGGQVAVGSVSIRQNQGVMDILQSSQRAAVNWQSFDVGSGATVNFSQPQASSVILNRVLGSTPSQIFGQINANGQVFLSNPNGVYFAPGSSVDVGALAATTHKISDADFMAGNYLLERQSATGSVVNQGTLSAQYGGYIALLAPEVRNQGVVLAKMGTVALAAGERYQLQIGSEGRLSNILVSPATMAALVDNGNAVEAPGGLIILSAQAANRLQAGVVKNRGVLNATGLVSEGGTIRLVASDRIETTGRIAADAAPNSAGQGGRIALVTDLTNLAGRADMAGGLSARGGSLGGDGGFIETSAANLVIADGAQVNTSAPQGKFGTWLLDPTDFTISSGAGASTSSGIGATTLQDSLSRGNVSIATDNALGADSGDLTVGAAVAWSANTTLSLSAYRNVNLNNAITASGTSGGLSVTAGVGGSGSINLAANVVTGGAQVYNGSLVLNTAATLQSTSAGVAVTGGIAPGTASTLALDSATASSVAGVISGATALTKSGAGTLTLSGTNTFTGTTTVNAGTLSLTNAAALGSVSGGTTVASGATLDIEAALGPEPIALNGGTITNLSVTTYSVSPSITLGANSTFFGPVGALIFTGSVTGNYALTKSGASQWGIAAPSNNWGDTVVVAGTLYIGASAGLGPSGVYNGNIALNGGNIRFSSGATQTFSGVISGGGSVSKSTSITGVLTLSGANTYTGGTVISAGTLKLASATALGDAQGTVSLTGGALDLNGQTIAYAKPLTLNGTGVSSGGALINSSATAASYAGLVTLGSDTSIVAGTGKISLTNAGNITSSNYSLTLGGAAGGSVASILGLGSGTLTKQDAGTWILAGANTYTGGTNVNAGTLSVTHAAGLGDVSGGTTVASGATLDIQANIGAEPITLNGGTLQSSSPIAPFTNSYTIASPVTMGAASILADTGLGTLTITGSVTGNYLLTKSGQGSVVLAGAANSWGGTAVTGGSLYLGGSNSYGTGADYSGAIAIGSGASLYYSSTASQTFSGLISGSGSLGNATAAGTTLTLTGANTYTGGTNVFGGTLKLGNATALGGVAGSVSITTGLLDLNG